jgi:hypothetical protein
MVRKGINAMHETDEKRLNNEAPETLTDEQIISEKTVARRSFLARTGAVLVGGAAALVLGKTAVAQSQDPDKPRNPDPDKSQDPDKPRQQDPDKPRSQDPDQADKTRPQDPDQADKARPQDPDKPRPQDPDKERPQDPDKPRPQDPDKSKPDLAKF